MSETNKSEYFSNYAQVLHIQTDKDDYKKEKCCEFLGKEGNSVFYFRIIE